jgi:hypothetical protein
MLSSFLKGLAHFFTVLVLATVFVSAQVVNVSVKVTPDSQNINPGQSATVKIETANVSKCTITGKPYNNFNIIKNGNILLRPTETTEYIFNCSGTNNTLASTKARVTIVPVVVPGNSPLPTQQVQQQQSTPAQTTQSQQQVQPQANTQPQGQQTPTLL